MRLLPSAVDAADEVAAAAVPQKVALQEALLQNAAANDEVNLENSTVELPTPKRGKVDFSRVRRSVAAVRNVVGIVGIVDHLDDAIDKARWAREAEKKASALSLSV